MSQEIVQHAAQTGLSIRPDQTQFTQEQAAVLRHMGIEGATSADAAVFLHVIQRTGLDPFARQIHMIGRRQKQGDQWVTKQTIQTGIDGYRLIADRVTRATGGTRGDGGTWWCGPDGQWVDVWLSSEPPQAAKVTVLRNGQPFTAVALYSEYVGTTRDGKPNSMWASKPAVMLAKCAEALAQRKAFPQDLSGIYTHEEMGVQDEEPQPATSSATIIAKAESAPEPVATVAEVLDAEVVAEPASTQQVDAIRRLVAELSMTNAGAGEHIRQVTKRADASTKNLTAAEAEAVIESLQALVIDAAPVAEEPEQGALDGMTAAEARAFVKAQAGNA